MSAFGLHLSAISFTQPEFSEKADPKVAIIYILQQKNIRKTVGSFIWTNNFGNFNLDGIQN